MTAELTYLIDLGRGLTLSTPTNFIRDAVAQLDPLDRMQVVLGPRGIGKTTLLLQYAKQHGAPERVAYAPLDDIYFSAHTLVDSVRQLREADFNLILLDEVAGGNAGNKSRYRLFPLRITRASRSSAVSYPAITPTRA